MHRTELDSLLGMRLVWFHITTRNLRAFTRNDFLLASSKIPSTPWPRNTKAKAKVSTSFPRLVVVKIQACGGDCFFVLCALIFPNLQSVSLYDMRCGFLSVHFFLLLDLLRLSIKVWKGNFCLDSDRIEIWVYNYIYQS